MGVRRATLAVWGELSGLRQRNFGGSNSIVENECLRRYGTSLLSRERSVSGLRAGRLRRFLAGGERDALYGSRVYLGGAKECRTFCTGRRPLGENGEGQKFEMARVIGRFGDSTYFGNAEDLDARPLHEKYASQFEEVKKMLMERNAFSSEIIAKEALTYYNELGLNEYYFQTASAATIGNNLACVIAAKILSESSKSDYFPHIRQECEDEVFWMAQANLQNRRDSQNVMVEKELEDGYLSLDGKGLGWRMQCYRSVSSLFVETESSRDHLRTYFLQRPEFPKVGILDRNEEELEKLIDAHFLHHKQGSATEEIFRTLNSQVVRDSTEQDIFINVAPRGVGFRIDCAFRQSPLARRFYSRLGDAITIWGLVSERKYIEPLANGVSIITVFVDKQPDRECGRLKDLTVEERVQRLVKVMRLAFILPRSKFLELAQDRKLSLHEAAYAFAATRFVVCFSPTVGPAFKKIAEVLKGSSAVDLHELNEVRTRLKQPPFLEDNVYDCVENNIHLVKKLYKEFQQIHNPRVYYENGEKLSEWREDADDLGAEIAGLDVHEATQIFKLFREFTRCVKRTNFWKDQKLSFAFRLDPSFLPKSDYPELPYSILFTVDAEFSGFHVRFADVARGGLRVVQSFSPGAYERNRQRAFDECYQLAHTQNLKNKDIPEGGSKGVILLNQSESAEHAAHVTPLAFKRYIDAFLDMLLPHERIVDHLQKDEVCFLGPDEHTGTGGLMDWAAARAKERGAWFWKAFTTGKMPGNGGIPHDLFGMTTSSVETFIRGILRKTGETEEEITKFQTGGPDGDLGANAILQSKCITTSLVDGSGVLHDPQGLNRAELVLLAKKKFLGEPTSAMDFDASLLSKEGFKVPVYAKDVTLPDGETVTSGLHFRNEFHLDPRGSADLFNPCGGRPESISSENVEKLFNAQGQPRFKYIVEGANVFITNESRRMLESRGVVLFKDASTNKGGVTSSSLEVLAALAMSDDEFQTHMQVPDIKQPGDFYTQYVAQVQQRIKENATAEFEILWKEGLRTKLPRTDLTDILSNKILHMNKAILNSSAIWHDQNLVKAALNKAIPPALVPGLLSLETLTQRVPEAYLKAICSKYLAAHFHYKYGVASSPFAVFDFFDGIKSGTP